MATSLLVLPIKKTRELLRARQVARQTARLLGYDATEQACIAAAVFEIGHQCLVQAQAVALLFQITESVFQVGPLTSDATSTPPLRLEKALPCGERPATADLVWSVQQLAAMTPLVALEEVQRQNQELLRALVELKACQAKLEQLTTQQAKPNAA